MGPKASDSVRGAAEDWGPSTRGMFAFPFLVILESRPPRSLGAIAEWLPGFWGLGYNIAREDERTGLVAIFSRAFVLGAPRLPAWGDAKRLGEEGE